MNIKNVFCYFCESDNIVQKIKETGRLLTSNDKQKDPYGNMSRFVPLEEEFVMNIAKYTEGKHAVLLDHDKLCAEYEIWHYSRASEFEGGCVKYIAQYEDGRGFANVLANNTDVIIPISPRLYWKLKRQIKEMPQELKDKYRLDVLGRAKTKSKGSYRTEMYKFKVRHGGLKISPGTAQLLADAEKNQRDSHTPLFEFRIWTDEDTVDIGGFIWKGESV